MGPKRKYNNRDNSKNEKTDLTGTPPRDSDSDSDSDSDATSISLQETPPRSQTPLLSDSDEEGALSQEDQDFVQALSQGNEGIEEDAINELVEDVAESQSQAEQSQSQSQEVLLAIESHSCEPDVAKEIQDIENRLIHPSTGGDRITQLYIELLRSSGENIQRMLENFKQAIRRMISSSTATAMFEQINEHVIPLVRTVATTCVGYYLGSYLLRYVGGILTTLLARHTTITLISLGSAGVHIIYNVGTREGEALLDQAVAAVNANIETFLTGVSRIGGITDSTRQTIRTHTLDAVKDNVQHAINQATGDYKEVEMANIKSLLEDLDSNNIDFQTKITGIQTRLNKLMAPVDVTEQGDNDGDGDFDHFGGKRVKRNRTKKTKAKKTIKRKAKKAKKTKKAKST